ncbi:MAG: SWF or SNF family helicase, partial [Nitriliruptoraceae bacterium]
MSVPASGVGVRHWWGDRLLALLDDTGAAAARAVQRGRALARRGAVEEVTLRPGRVTGTVLEDRAAPIEVEIGWPVTDEGGWERAAERLGRRLRPIAALLEGGLAPVLVEELAAAGIELLPDVAALTPRCGCGASPSWCRHAAAVHTVAATRLDRDPMLLLELSGRTRDQLLAALRGVAPAAAVSAEQRPGPVVGDLDDLEV